MMVSLSVFLALTMSVSGGSRNAGPVSAVAEAVKETHLHSTLTPMWRTSVISATDNVEQDLRSFWVGIRNADSIPRIACISVGGYGIYIDSKTESFGGMLWAATAHGCDPNSHLRKLVLPGETFYEHAVINFSKVPRKPMILTVSLVGYDFGSLKEEVDLEDASRIDLRWSNQTSHDSLGIDLLGKGSDTEALQSGVDERNEPSSNVLGAKSSTWSPSVLRAGNEYQVGGSWRYWVGVKNNSGVAQAILWPSITHEIVHDGKADRSDEVSAIGGLPRAFLVLPGQTFFRMKVIDAGSVSKPGPAELMLRVSVTEATMTQSAAVSQKHIDLEWTETLQVK